MAGAYGAATAAPDLNEIDRTMLKEPVYESERPQYCLLVFGPEAKVRVWLVLDGDAMHVDRNGNGDLTDPGERISPRDVWHQSEERPNIEVIRVFDLFTHSRQAAETAKEPILFCTPEVRWFYVQQFVPNDDYPYKAQLKMYRQTPFRVAILSPTGGEQDARVAFTDRPQDAPILHFLGSQQVTWNKREPLQFQKGETAEVFVGLTSPGLNGTVRTYSGVPKTAHLVAEITFPAREPGGAPIYRRVELAEPGG